MIRHSMWPRDKTECTKFVYNVKRGKKQGSTGPLAVAHTLNRAAGRQKQVDLRETEAGLVYEASSSKLETLSQL